jgi:hypothetical protein
MSGLNTPISLAELNRIEALLPDLFDNQLNEGQIE